jgi:hypothetical protein
VDPGRTNNDCNPGNSFEGKVIIVAYPDSRLWGGNEFTKFRKGSEGVFIHYPVRSLEELLAARPIISPDLDAAEVKERYRLFGGSPRSILSRLDTLLQIQRRAVALLSPTHLAGIDTGRLGSLDSYDSTQPESSFIAHDLPADSEGNRIERFDQYRIILVSAAVEELLNKRAGTCLNPVYKLYSQTSHRTT